MKSLWKPWFIWRPHQILLRALRRGAVAPAGIRPLPVAWGATIDADASKMIGRSIWQTGLFDLAVSEVLARLIGEGDTVVDAGANIGYMTVLAATAAGPTGRVLSFEPHPDLLPVLRGNIDRAGRNGSANIELFDSALGCHHGAAELQVPAADNDGLGFIGSGARAPDTLVIPIQVTTLDQELGSSEVAVMKMDVEGYEAMVLHGGARALAGRRIRHIVYEDHEGVHSETSSILLNHGFEIFAIGWDVRGLRLEPAIAGNASRAYEAPSYLATLAPEEATMKCADRGWKTLRKNGISKYPPTSPEQNRTRAPGRSDRRPASEVPQPSTDPA